MQTRRRRSLLTISLSVLAAVLALGAPLTVSAGGGSFDINMSLRASGLAALTQVTNAGDGTNRLFLVERRGTIRVYQNGSLRSGYFMDIRSKVEDGGERGLLGLAFHPDFETNRQLFVFYTRNGGDIVVSQFTTNASRTNVNESSHSPLMLIEHSSQTNHNGGAITFGPDGFLYVGVGDGGGSGDPGNDAQQPSKNALGKILRVDPDGTGRGTFGNYSVPSSNPFWGGSSRTNDIVWAYGLRNPWRISFDRVTGGFWISDVGQNRYEEVNREPPSFDGGRNYGWRVYEGRHCYSGCPKSGTTFPVLEYSISGSNCAVTGGYVYRGTRYPLLAGHYVFADFCSGRFWTMPFDGSQSDVQLRRDSKQMPTSFGESESGELYAVTINGRLYQIGAS